MIVNVNILRLINLSADKQSETGIKRISRKAIHGFNLIPFNVMEESSDSLSKSHRSSTVSRDVLVCYTLPIHGAPQLHLQ